MAIGTLTRFFFLPELELVRSFPIGQKGEIGVEVFGHIPAAMKKNIEKYLLETHEASKKLALPPEMVAAKSIVGGFRKLTDNNHMFLKNFLIRSLHPMSEHSKSRLAVAKELGISPNTLRGHIKRLAIDV